MKMKKGLLMVVLLLALSSIMAAMSYTSATVTSAMTGTVKNTNEALLALSPGTHEAATIDKGILNIDFDKGYKGNKIGLQRQSEYTWNELFTIKNNSENEVKVTIKTEANPAKGVKIYVRIGKADTWKEINSNSAYTLNNLGNNTGNQGQGQGQGNKKNNEVSIDVKVEVSDDATMGKFNPNLVVSGNAQ